MYLPDQNRILFLDMPTAGGLMGSVGMNNVTYSTTTKQQHQQQQQQQLGQREHLQIKGMSSATLGVMATANSSSAATGTVNTSNTQTFDRQPNPTSSSQNITYNNGMMTLPKAGTLHHTNSIGYGRNPGGGGAGSGGGGSIVMASSSISNALLDSRGNMLLASSSAGTGDCMTLPRNLSMSSRHNPSSGNFT